MGMQVKLNTGFHTKTNGEGDPTIQTLEYMFRACVIDFRGSLDYHRPLIEFS